MQLQLHELHYIVQKIPRSCKKSFKLEVNLITPRSLYVSSTNIVITRKQYYYFNTDYFKTNPVKLRAFFLVNVGI